MTSGNFQAVNFESLNATIFVCTALGLFNKMLESIEGGSNSRQKHDLKSEKYKGLNFEKEEINLRSRQ